MKTNDIRNREMKATVKSDEDATTAIIRYMRSRGFATETWTDGKGLEHRFFHSKSYREIWISMTNYIDENTVSFTLDGNK